jgi:hypothetical protein
MAGSFLPKRSRLAEGTSRDLGQAREQYRAVAAQDCEPDAKRRAVEALTRLATGKSMHAP